VVLVGTEKVAWNEPSCSAPTSFLNQRHSTFRPPPSPHPLSKR
jgi:hypothetical protein